MSTELSLKQQMLNRIRATGKSGATHSNEIGVDIRTLQVLLGHADIRTTEIYVHANKDRATASRNPLEELLVSIPFEAARRKLA